MSDKQDEAVKLEAAQSMLARKLARVHPSNVRPDLPMMIKMTYAEATALAQPRTTPANLNAPDKQEALAGDDRNGVELRRLVDQALDALDSIAGDRTPKFFPETSYDCARREAADLRAALAALTKPAALPKEAQDADR